MFKPSRTQLEVLKLIYEGRELSDYVPAYNPRKHRGFGAFPVTIAARAASQLQKAGLVARNNNDKLYVTKEGLKWLSM